MRPLREVLDRLTFRLSDSDLEIHFRPIAASAGLPPPLSKQRVNDFEVDFFWPDLGLSSRPTACATTAPRQPRSATRCATERTCSPA